MLAFFDVTAGCANAQSVLEDGIPFGDVHQRDFVPVGDRVQRDDFEVAALAIAADTVAGLDGFEHGGADVVGGVDDEYFFHGEAFRCLRWPHCLLRWLGLQGVAEDEEFAPTGMVD